MSSSPRFLVAAVSLTAVLQANYDMETQLHNLGQKYMGIRTNKHKAEMFKTQDIKPDGGHIVPVSVSRS